MEIETHEKANSALLGTPVLIESGHMSEIELVATEKMAVDGRGLVHGGFTFGLADYAAMLAVNHPNVVLAGAECRFLAPVKVGEVMKAKASVVKEAGRKREVEVDVYVDGERVFEGAFDCFILERHVLDR